MRRLLVLLGLLVASGCAGDDETATETVTVTTATTVTRTETVTETATTTQTTSMPSGPWAGLPRPHPESGRLPVDAFNAYAESVDEPWERDVRGTVDEYVGFDDTEVANVAYQATSSGPSTSASLTLDGLFDDSVRSLRYDLTLVQRQDGTWRIDTAQWAQRCHEGRGHQEFSPERCV